MKCLFLVPGFIRALVKNMVVLLLWNVLQTSLKLMLCVTLLLLQWKNSLTRHWQYSRTAQQVAVILTLSPGAINVYQISGRMGGTNQRFIEPIYTIGELQSTYKRITELAEIIYNAFYIDRLMDLNNETRMTAYETQVRTEFRGQSLNTVFARQIAELFTPLVERVFNICYEWGLLGVIAGSPEEQALIMAGEQDILYIPDEIAELAMKGKDIFKIQFISPAARIMRQEELQGIERLVSFAINTAVQAGDLSILDNIDFDVLIHEYQELVGASSRIMRAKDAVEELRANRSQQQQMQMQLQVQQLQAEREKDLSQARKNNTAAGIPIQMQAA